MRHWKRKWARAESSDAEVNIRTFKYYMCGGRDSRWFKRVVGGQVNVVMSLKVANRVQLVQSTAGLRVTSRDRVRIRGSSRSSRIHKCSGNESSFKERHSLLSNTALGPPVLSVFKFETGISSERRALWSNRRKISRDSSRSDVSRAAKENGLCRVTLVRSSSGLDRRKGKASKGKSTAGQMNRANER
jgi:hypothetical protein